MSAYRILIKKIQYYRLLRGIQNIASHWQRWLMSSLENSPFQLKCVKMDQAKRFSNLLKRHAAFLHLSQVVRPIFVKLVFQQLIREILSLMPDILEKVGLITEQMDTDEETALEIVADLNQLLESDFSLEALVHWLDNKVLKLNYDQQSLLFWIYALGKMSCCLTETRSKYFVTYHLLSSFVQEYILLAFETQISEKEERQLYLQFDHYLKFRLSSDFIKPPTSCFLVDERIKKQSKKKTNLNAERPQLLNSTEFTYCESVHQNNIVGINEEPQYVGLSGCSVKYNHRERSFMSYTHENYNQPDDTNYFYN